ncbi:hypothetical protein ACEWY4_002676 [Coilia grayii]|uniref:VWFA domain-containing protein n=1 Tax=Coilia grayii TaxID=363190 RepID=A0ABD1KP02_9TELE
MNSHGASLIARGCPERCGLSGQTADEDDGLLVTNINHSKDLMRMHTLRADPGVCQSTADWLESNSLRSTGLSLCHFLSHCSSSSPGTTGEQLDISAEELGNFEMKLYHMIELYHHRIRWLTEGSRKVFGVVRGSKVAVLVDTSDVNCSTDRLLGLQRNLLGLLDEQLRHKREICLISFGSEVASLWDGLRDTSPLRLREVKDWVLQLGPSGGCSLLQAVEMALALPELHSLLIILGSCPDQPSGLVCDVVQQCLLGRQMSVHAVGYCCGSPVAIGVLDDSTDLELLWAEIKAARDVLNHIHSMRSGCVEDAEVVTGIEDMSLSEKMSETNHPNAPLNIQAKGLLPVTSQEWLKTHGLKAQKLGLYQVLAPNAYSPLKEFVPILGKTVTATVHERAMVPFEWHDGTVKNVHVDLPLLFHYQKQLRSAMRELDRRLVWLSSTGSRQIWGTVCEPRVQILVDISSLNDRHWLHILHSLRLLLEEHLSSQQSFNVIVFGTEVESWREALAPVSPKNLQEAWQWLQSRQCAGGRNTLGALRQALEGDHHQRTTPLPQGLYLFTSGVPDQDMAAISAYVSECCSTSDVRLHVCLFTAPTGTSSDPPPTHPLSWADTALALRRLARAGRGRFHWISSTGGQQQQQQQHPQWAEFRCSDLVELLTQRTSTRAPVAGQARPGSAPVRSVRTGGQQDKLPPPRPTLLTLSRLWLKQYGIKSLRLDLHKLASGPDCVHHKKLVQVTQQNGSAKYCAVLPSVELNGRVRHLQMTPAELRQYVSEAQRLLLRYYHRMQWLLSGQLPTAPPPPTSPIPTHKHTPPSPPP